MVHSDFVLEYSKKVAENNLLVGRRVMLSKKLTESIKNNFYVKKGMLRNNLKS